MFALKAVQSVGMMVFSLFPVLVFFVRTAEGSSSPALNAAAAGICWHVLACAAIDSCCVVWCGVLLCLCCHQARLLTPTGLTMLMWSVGNMDKAPPKAWVAKLLVATQVGLLLGSENRCLGQVVIPSLLVADRAGNILSMGLPLLCWLLVHVLTHTSMCMLAPCYVACRSACQPPLV